jgi:hypothetical protein
MLQKQAITLNFAQGLDKKTDPYQVPLGKFLNLSNSVFKSNGSLDKRNGFQPITQLPNSSSTSVTTFNDNLLALGTSVQAFSADSNQWVNGGTIQPMTLETLPIVRGSSQSDCDVAIAPNGLACAVWLDSDTNTYYQIVDSVTGQVIVARTQMPSGANFPRAFSLGNYFVITFVRSISSVPHLQYIAISTANTNVVKTATDLSTLILSATAGYDAQVINNGLYVAFPGSDGGGAIRVTYIDALLNQHNTLIKTGFTGSLFSVTADNSQGSPTVWVSFYNSTSHNTYSMALTTSLGVLLNPTLVLSATTLNALTSVATGKVLTLFFEVANTLSYSGAKYDYVSKNTITQTGTVGTSSVLIRGAGIFSRAFYYPADATEYLFITYGQAYQPTYFLIDSLGNIVSKFAYSNGGGYVADQIISSVTVIDSNIYLGYLFKDQLVAVNKTQGVSAVAGIYAQTGINLLHLNFTDNSNFQEIGANLNISGGLTWAYDGAQVTEQGFHVWPEDIGFTVTNSGGSVTSQQYYYQVCYEWTDAQGNLFRSAPSVPLNILVATGSSNTVTLKIPTLHFTSKNKVRIVIYRWSQAQQTYYQITSILNPILNDKSVDFITYADTANDSAILGNVILYTTGGVVENIAPPSFTDLTLFDNRLWGIDSENPNQLWFSKQVIQSTPVEFSDLFTYYVAPSAGAQGSTGPCHCIAPMDSNLIIFKKDAIYYVAGIGPDNTGANLGYSQPIFITATVGSVNKRSIVLIPSGLMFQSDKGIWLLGRDMSTNYIGWPVEAYNDAIVESSVVVPGTNQVRFTLNNGLTLMYDYFYEQWGTFDNIPAISSTIYKSLHTYVDQFGVVFQETPDQYLDGSNPVLMSFQTSWIKLAGLQGYQRAYFFYMLAQFFSPHKIQMQIAYDYAPSALQTVLITPDNYNAPWGGDETWGQSSPWGGTPDLEQWRVFLQNQRCQSFQITFNEIFDSSYGQPASIGLKVSGLNLVVGLKKGYVPIKAKNSVG